MTEKPVKASEEVRRAYAAYRVAFRENMAGTMEARERARTAADRATHQHDVAIAAAQEALYSEMEALNDSLAEVAIRLRVAEELDPAAGRIRG